jgi:hypothetical protein
MSPAPPSLSFTPPTMACQPARSRFLMRPHSPASKPGTDLIAHSVRITAPMIAFET